MAGKWYKIVEGVKVSRSAQEQEGFVFIEGADQPLGVDALTQAKRDREQGRFAPVTVAGQTFDADARSQELIEGAVRKFAVLDQALRGDGSLDWTLADNTVVPVTLEGLTAVEDALAIRDAELHYQLQAVKGA